MDDRPKPPPYNHLPNPPDLLKNARDLRHNLTSAEQYLWYLLRRNQLGGFHFRRQHSFGPFTLDFYCAAAHLCVELDGGQHAEDMAKDARRTAFLERHGISVIRIWNNELFRNTEGALQTLYDAVVERTRRRGGITGG